MFLITRLRANRKLAKIGLHFNYKIRKTKEESWSSHNTRTIYLNPNDRKSSMMADQSELHILLHEFGHIFVAKHAYIKKIPEVILLFGDMRKFYRRDLSKRYENPDFISHYAQVHPEDNFAEVFAVYAHYGGSLKKLETFCRKNHKSKKVFKQFLWLHRFLTEEKILGKKMITINQSLHK